MSSATENTAAVPQEKENPTPPAKIEQPPAATVDDADSLDDVPDPDEDDLDDLDDMLDDFSAVNIQAPASRVPPPPTNPPTAAGAGAPSDAPTEEGAFSEEEFAKQLQAGMADLLGELDSSPDMHAQFETIFKELGAAASTNTNQPAPPISPTGGASSSAPSGSAVPNPADESFQETIRRTMERMQTSGDQATAAAAAEGSDDFLAELLKQMQSGGAGLDGEGNEEDFSKMLMGMMEQLTNKEILYEPMKELDDKFPAWMEKNRATTSADDLKKYEEQQTLVREIVGKFEEAGYSDSNAADREYIVDRMQKMQASGSPPSDLVGDMPSAQDVLNMPDESCNPQ
ncbi:Pex19 protein family-domain-containing protein [Chaetomium sp. MPI-SDFR-AT-0129]|nr:Pex19 protein family-domain-containing protein [Chaetomium sp. MPI-SDFR-AT-0129]